MHSFLDDFFKGNAIYLIFGGKLNWDVGSLFVGIKGHAAVQWKNTGI